MRSRSDHGSVVALSVSVSSRVVCDVSVPIRDAGRVCVRRYRRRRVSLFRKTAVSDELADIELHALSHVIS